MCSWIWLGLLGLWQKKTKKKGDQKQHIFSSCRCQTTVLECSRSCGTKEVPTHYLLSCMRLWDSWTPSRGEKDVLTTWTSMSSQQDEGIDSKLLLWTGRSRCRVCSSGPPASHRLWMGHASLCRPKLYLINFCFGCWEISNYHHSLELEYNPDAVFSLLLSSVSLIGMPRSDLLHLGRCCISLASLPPWMATTLWLKKVAE